MYHVANEIISIKLISIVASSKIYRFDVRGLFQLPTSLVQPHVACFSNCELVKLANTQNVGEKFRIFFF